MPICAGDARDFCDRLFGLVWAGFPVIFLTIFVS